MTRARGLDRLVLAAAIGGAAIWLWFHREAIE